MKLFLNRLRSEHGFILVFAMLMILLLMVFMTAIVGAVGYTNNVTLEKSEEQQLQLTAQSAVGTLKELFAKEENMAKLSALAAAGAEQDYDLSASGITDKVTAKVTESSQPGYALLTVTAYDETGKMYTTTTLLPMVAAQGAKNDLINNMIVSYWPNANAGLTANLDYSNNVFKGSIIVDNEFQPGNYGNKDQFKNFINEAGTSVGTDDYAVKVKGGVFHELVTTGNLLLDASLPISGTGDTTIASAVGQLAVTQGVIGDGTDGISQLGAGGYFEHKVGTNSDETKKKGNILIGSTGKVTFEDPIDIISRDRVSVNLNKVEGVLKNCFIGGDLTYTSTEENNMNVQGDIQVYKSATFNINKKELIVGEDVATGNSATFNMQSGGKVKAGDSIATATGDLTIKGSGNAEAKYLLSGKSLNVNKDGSVNVKLDGNGSYAAFSGGNYGVGNTSYLSKDEDDRGSTTMKGVTTSGAVVVNNKEESINGIDVLTKDESEEGLNGFKFMNSTWLTKAQQVYKGGWWSDCTKINFAVALLFDSSVMNNAGHSNYITYANDSDYYRNSSFITDSSKRYDPNALDNDEEEKKKNWQWYLMDDEEYYGDEKVPVSHELGYTTDDNIFLIRRSLQKALGGPTDSTNLNINATAQGEFVDTARTAIPYDSAILEIQVNYPHYANYDSTPQVNEESAGYASIEEYNDGYLIGAQASSTGYNNFGRLEFTNDGNKLKTADSEYDIAGKTLYFRVNSPIMPGGWGDFYITSDQEEIKINNKIVIEYTLNGTEETDLTSLSYVRFFVDPTKKITFGASSSIVGDNLGSVDENNVDFNYNDYHYTNIMPEVYLYCAQPSNAENIRIDTPDFKGYIIAPWSIVNMKSPNVPKDQEVFKGVILCKNLIKADGGTYEHYKPLAFGYAMSDSVFVLPEEDD